MDSGKLKQIIEDKGVRIEGLADILGINKSTIYRWTNGDREPKVDNIMKLCKALGISIEDIM